MMQEMPNVPRDPEDPREKLKKFLQERMNADKLMDEADYRNMSAAPAQTLMDSNRDIGLAQALNRSAAGFGSIGGRTADTRPASEYGDQLQGQNSNALKMIQGQRAEMADMDDRQLKMKSYLADKMQASEDKRLDRDMLGKKLDAQLEAIRASQGNTKRRIDLQEEELNLKKNKPGLQLTPAQEAADRKYGSTNYLEWTGGGQAQFLNNQSLLNDALGKVKGLRDYWLSPRVDALLPDSVRPEVTKVVQQDVSKAAIGAARAALGSQFTAQENFWVQRLSYDPGLSAEQNIQKIKRNLAEIEAIAEDNDALAAEHESKGTISNYRSKRLKRPQEAAAPVSPQPAGGFSDNYDTMSEEELDRLLMEGQ